MDQTATTYTTQNTEYVFTAGKCTQVTDLRTREVQPWHPVLGRSITCAVRIYPNGGVEPIDAPAEGTALCFDRFPGEERSIVTSRLVKAPVVS